MRLFKTTSIYFIGIIIEKGLAFMLIPLYTHYLSTTDYGILTIIQSIIAILIILFSLSFNGSASRYHIYGNSIFRRYHYGNIFSYVTIFSLIGASLFYIFGDYILNFFKIPFYPYAPLAIAISYLSIIYSIYQLKLQMEQKALAYVFNNIAKFIISTSLIIYLIVVAHKSVDGVLFGMLLGFLLLVIYFIATLKRDEIRFNLNRKLFKKYYKYSIYLVPHNLAGVLNSFLDRFFITGMMNLSQAGIFALGGQIAGVLSIFSSAINSAITPIVLNAYKSKDYNFLINLANISILFILLMAVFLSIFSLDIIHLVSPKSYAQASFVLSILGFYFVVQMYYFMTSSVLFYVEKATKYVAVATLLSLGLNFIFNYFFIKLWGIKGASFATLLSMIIVNYIVIFIANRFIKIEFEHIKIHLFVILGFIVSYMSNIFNFGGFIKCFIFIFFTSLIIYSEWKNPLIKSLRGKF